MSTPTREWINNRIASVIRFAQVCLNTASGDGDSVQGHETTNEEAEGGYQYQTRRIWPFGIRSRPPKGCDAVVVHVFGGASNGVMVGAESPEYGPDDLEDGEVAIYAKKSGAVIKIDKDGKVTIDAPNTTDVVVNGGTLKVARDTDPTNNGTWAHTPASGTGVTPCSLVYVPPGGVPTTIDPLGVAVTGKINGGAAHFKG